MKCPVCKTHELQAIELEKNLLANECEQCGGHWISTTNYWNWLKKHGPTLPEKPFADVVFQVNDTLKAKLCPDCGRILIKYKFGEEEIKEKLEKFYREKFGQEDYGKLKRMKQWLEQHPQRSALLAYLNDENPYKI